jgi:hypothetical protein
MSSCELPVDVAGGRVESPREALRRHPEGRAETAGRLTGLRKAQVRHLDETIGTIRCRHWEKDGNPWGTIWAGQR